MDIEDSDVSFWESFNRDIWKIILCVIGLLFGIFYQRPIIVFFSFAAIFSWLVRRKF